MKYTLVSDIPKDFYHEMHRTAHFIDFANTSSEVNADLIDRED